MHNYGAYIMIALLIGAVIVGICLLPSTSNVEELWHDGDKIDPAHRPPK